MRLELVDSKHRVYLDPHELELYCNYAPDREGLAAKIMGYTGTRGKMTGALHRSDIYNPSNPDVEIYVVEVTGAKDTRDTESDTGKHRYTWCPDFLYEEIEEYCEARGIGDDDSLFDVEPDTVRDEHGSIADELAKETGEEGWLHVSSHDFRIFFATNSARRLGLPIELVMDMGDWSTREAINPYLETRLPIDIQNDLYGTEIPDYIDIEIPKIRREFDRAEEEPDYDVDVQAGLDEFEPQAGDD